MILISLVTTQAWSQVDPCFIKTNLESRNDRINYLKTIKEKTEVEELFKKLENECQLQMEYSQLRSKGFSLDTPVDIDNISIVKALRFIDIDSYRKKGLQNNIEVPFIYQPASFAGDEKRTDLVWRNWQKGIANISYLGTLLRNGDYSVSLQDLKDSHKNFYQLGLKGIDSDDFYNSPGEFKQPKHGQPEPYERVLLTDRFNTWQIKSKPESERIKKAFEKINNKMFSMGLLPGVAWVDNNGRIANLLAYSNDNYVQTGPMELILPNMTYWVSFLNEYINIIRDSYINIPSYYPLMSPLEFTTFMQQWLVIVHPFHDGNGRTSRYWQDVLLKTFKLPYAPSGKLANDSDVYFSDYYATVYEELVEQNNIISNCLKLKTNYEVRENQNPKDQYNCKSIN